MNIEKLSVSLSKYLSCNDRMIVDHNMISIHLHTEDLLFTCASLYVDEQGQVTIQFPEVFSNDIDLVMQRVENMQRALQLSRLIRSTSLLVDFTNESTTLQ